MGIRTGERTPRDVRDQRDRGSFYERQFHRLINDIQEIIDRPEKIADYVQDHDDIQDVLTRARQARW